MLSKKTKYAFHALTYLGKKEDKKPVLISDIAEKTRVPKKFLESILLDLKKAGILTSKMGKGGGYYLLKDPEDVKLADVIRMFNGPIALLPCVSLNYYEPCDECTSEETCGLNKIMIEVRDETLKIVANKSLQDILTAEK
ncbi:Rrf2 family transcriptional regulator [Paracrocinitomix mangrovi]|uniref:RrF2 family transcriptional regulator n=1 Tax=Paracrocinitomix mangrovi TaxID=2862509 RepID=UPI001C8D47CF|nr:Rrf2 family transcriptional regulator [Paracrocinitomix mangrovi]UKN01766.1 Rrf2 family transcriptional regulator [Paracrocinitomix mangrovi]